MADRTPHAGDDARTADDRVRVSRLAILWRVLLCGMEGCPRDLYREFHVDLEIFGHGTTCQVDWA